jgi:hypothetical protein
MARYVDLDDEVDEAARPAALSAICKTLLGK